MTLCLSLSEMTTEAEYLFLFTYKFTPVTFLFILLEVNVVVFEYSMKLAFYKCLDSKGQASISSPTP